jgi:hypothetical protein
MKITNAEIKHPAVTGEFTTTVTGEFTTIILIE